MRLEITATTLHIKGQQQIILVMREQRRQRFHQDQADTERTMRGGLLEWRNILNLFKETERDNQLLLSAVTVSTASTAKAWPRSSIRQARECWVGNRPT